MILASIARLSIDHVEADGAQGGGDIGGVVGRIGQWIGVAVGAVADDQRHAVGRSGRGNGRDHQQHQTGKCAAEQWTGHR
jgi:hypothetical protein